MRRPLRDRGILPLRDTRGSSEDNASSDKEIPYFESMDDLPDSPMLRQYVRNQAKQFNVEPEDVINTRPVRDYMKKLGVWELAKQKNR